MIHILTVILAGLLPTYIVRFSIFGIPTNFFEVSVWVLFIATLCLPRTRKQLMVALGEMPRSVKMWVFLFVVTAVISTFYSPAVRSSLGILKGWIVTPILFGLLVYTARYSDVLVHKKIIRSLIYSGLVVSLLGISQIDGFMRIRSVYDVPNSFALFLVPILIIAVWVGIRTKERFYVSSALIMLIAILGTQSLGACIALLSTLGIGVLLGRLKLGLRHYVVVLSVFVLSIFIFFLSGRAEYLASPFIYGNTANSVTVRLQLWDIGIRLIREHPIPGVGLGQFEGAYQGELHRLFKQEEQLGISVTPYRLASEFVFRDPHNWIISFWLNTGLLGLLSFVILNLFVLKRIKDYFSRSDKKHYYAQAVALALISILVFGLFDTTYWKNDLAALWWVLFFMGLLA